MADLFSVPNWFYQPCADFKPATFWFWHAIPSQPDIKRQLADMADTGIGTVMIQARLAMPIEDYLSPNYLAAYRFACAEARRLGLRVTIYDEYNWMSGHGGGRTVAGADHLRERHLFWTSGTVGADGSLELAVSGIASPFFKFLGDTGRNWAYEGGNPLWDEWAVVAAAAMGARSHDTGSFAPPVNGGMERSDVEAAAFNVADVTDRARLAIVGDRGCTIALDAAGLTAGTEIAVFVAARCHSSRMINYLMPEAAERFADVVYAPLLAAAGGTAEGFFFDHPYAGFYGWDQHHGDLGNSLLWDDRLPGLLDAETPLALHLLALTRDIGATTTALRTRFLAAYQGQLHDAFFGTLSRWTAARGVGFTGHELLTHVGAWGLQEGLGGFDPRSMPGVDYFAVDAFRTHTSVDAADYAPQLSARFGDSVARAHGRKRCTIEQYSTGRETGLPGLAGQWGLTLARFRAQAIRHLLFGARQILLHAYNASDGEDGDTRLLSPRFDFPPGFNFEPWWEDCPHVFRELPRISAFLEDGEPLRPVALFYPLATINAGPASPDCTRHFGWWAEALARAGIGYDIIDEAGLARLGFARVEPDANHSVEHGAGAATPSPGKCTCDHGYTTLILPSVETLAASASAEYIAAFVEAGGQCFASGSLPVDRRSEGDGTRRAQIVDGLAHRPNVQHWPSATKTSVTEAVATIERPRPDIRFDNGPAWNTVLRDGDAWKIALCNDEDRTRRVTITLDAPAGHVRRWDPESGTVSLVELDAGDAGFSFDVGAQEICCLTIHDGGSDSLTVHDGGSDSDRDGDMNAPTHLLAVPATTPECPPPISLAEGWTFEIRDGLDAAIPIDVTRGWEVQGFADFAGAGIYRRDVTLPPLAPGLVWTLVLPSLHETAECFANGTSVGRHIAGDAAFRLEGLSGPVQLAVHVRNTAANRYYPGTPFWNGAFEASGLTEVPRLEAQAV